MPRSIRVVAPAKVNLFLGVGERMPDGYHRVDTVLHTIEFADEIVLSPSPHLTLTCLPGVGVPAEKNLAFKAALAMAAAFARPAEVAIELTKRVPHGAGLGGGSSDAAAVVAGLAALWGVPRDDPSLAEVAASLGADVPFFLLDSPALMTGRGDVMARAVAPLTAPVVLVRPDAGVSTAAAYRAFDASPVPAGEAAEVIDALESRDVVAVATALSNNMEQAASAVVPDVAEALAWVRARDGILGAAVAGSGSAVFGIARDDEAAEKSAVGAAAEGWWAETTRFRGRGVEVIGGGGEA